MSLKRNNKIRGKGLLILSLCLLSCRFSLAGEGEYAVSGIPAALWPHAHVIKRMEKISFEVLHTGTAILRKKYALTIMDEKGDRHAGFLEYYDKLHEIRNIEGTLYDANGKELKKLKNKQIIDLTGMDESTLMDDSRRKFHHFYYKVYPYTVQYEVEIKYNGTLFFPVWLPREDENFSVEHSSISIITPLNYTVRYKAFNYIKGPVQATAGDKKILSWETGMLPAIEDEYASPAWHELNTVVLFAPTAFEIEKYKGNMDTWQDFGKFVYSLKKDRDQLPDAVKQVVHRLTDTVKNTREKIVKLYEYLQKNTRYISVQLGIGGWQPYDAGYVSSKAYGDCKALTNYMYSLLKEAGIHSVYTLVRAGRNANKIITDFPSQQFNHVILCVPLQRDTIWLECTSQTLPAGYLGEFTCNRYALLVSEQGGTLVRTPAYSLQQNLETRHIKASLDEEATLKIMAYSRYEGLQQDLYHDLIHGVSKDKVKKFLQEELDFATYEINSFDYKETRTSLPVVDETLDISVSNYATFTGKRLFIVPNVMTRTHLKLAPDTSRKYELELNYAYKDVDTVEINLPEGYKEESLPRDIDFSSQFGTYKAGVRLSGNHLFYYRSLEFKGGRYPASAYPELVKFYETIYKADRNKVVLVKNQ